MLLALVGNQNCGKTTLFNRLTGSKQYVGNFPGITVQKKEGRVLKLKDAILVDLPGIYSLLPYTPEEILCRDFLLNERPDVIINIIDATNIERNLYLTIQLLELDIPIVIALNMMDDIDAAGGKIDAESIEKKLDIPIVPISAKKNKGIDVLIEKVKQLSVSRKKPMPKIISREIEGLYKQIEEIITKNSIRLNYPKKYSITKLIEKDTEFLKHLEIRKGVLEQIEEKVLELENKIKMDRFCALADMRYRFIEKICSGNIFLGDVLKAKEFSKKLDKIFTSRYFAIPIFLIIILIIFYFTFGGITQKLGDILSGLITSISEKTDVFLNNIGLSVILNSLIVDGIISGIGSVVSFLPTILMLFFLLSILEGSGYFARIAYFMDAHFAKIGLSGKSIVPMLLGFGCSVPAIMATRTLIGEKDRKITVFIIPFMSCSAKLPVYTMFAAAFFSKNRIIVMASLYLIGILVGVLSAKILSKFYKDKSESSVFLLELPPYRIPTLRTVLTHMSEKTKDFLKRAFSIILLASIVIWLLKSFDWNFNFISDSRFSILSYIGILLVPVFIPLGFGDWRICAALLTGLAAKETVISTLSILLNCTKETLSTALMGLFTPLSAFSFLVFTLLYSPCVASIAVAKRELGSAWLTFKMILFQTSVAWGLSFIIYRIGKIFFA
ncbi:MAG: ferrous iron transport protein B [Eubacteriales bacterium]